MRGQNSQPSSSATLRRSTNSKKIDPVEKYELFKKEKVHVTYINSQEQVKKLAKYLRHLNPSAIGLDFETVSKDAAFSQPWNGALRLIQIGVDEPAKGIKPQQFLIDCFKCDPSPLRNLLRSNSVEKQIHNLRYEQEWSLVQLGISIGNIYDTVLAWRSINSKLKKMPLEEAQKIVPNWQPHTNGLGTIVEKYLQMKIPKEHGASDWGRERLKPDQVLYAAMDVAVMPEVVKETKRIAKELQIEDVIDRHIASIKNSVKEKVDKDMDAKHDDASRIARALSRASSITELEEIFKASHQMSLSAPNYKDVQALYKDRKQTIRNSN